MTRSVRQLQPTIGRLGGYNIAQLTAPRVPVPQTNNLLELAKGLKVTSDIVVTYDQIKQTQNRQQEALEKARALKGKEREQYEQAVMTEGATQFDLDPGGVSRQMEAYEREVRKLAEEGKMPEQANALFMLGAKQAKGKVLANSVYREMLFNPQTISETIDPIQTIQEKRQELFSRPEFQSELVKEAALENIEKIEQAFIKDVNDRFDAVDIEDGKTNWLLNGKPLMNQAINGQLDINDPSITNWINDKAGLFKGSRKFAWDNLIKEQLREGLSKDPGELGSISPNQVDKFLDALRKLDLGGGVKFADAEVGNAITSFYDSTENIRIKWENNKNKQLNEDYEKTKGLVVDLLLESMGDGTTVIATEADEIRQRFLSSLPITQKQKGLNDFNDILKNIDKPSDDLSLLVVSNIETNIAEGEDLTAAVKEINKSFQGGSISAKQRLNLLDKIDKERDFEQLVYKTEGVRKLSEGYENVITGFNTTRIGKATYEEGYFTQLGVPSDADPNDRNKLINGSVYNQIRLKTGSEYDSKRFVNSRYYAFNKEFKQANLLKFKEYEADPQTSPQEAANKVLEEMQETARSVFKNWEKASIEEAKRLYNIEIFTTGEELQQAFPEDL